MKLIMTRLSLWGRVRALKRNKKITLTPSRVNDSLAIYGADRSMIIAGAHFDSLYLLNFFRNFRAAILRVICFRGARVHYRWLYSHGERRHRRRNWGSLANGLRFVTLADSDTVQFFYLQTLGRIWYRNASHISRIFFY